MSATPDYLDEVLTVLAKVWPAIGGALISLNWSPPAATKLDRAFAALCAFVLGVGLTPMAMDLSPIQSRGTEIGVGILIAMFGLIAAGQIVAAIKVAELGTVVRDLIRKLLRLQ